MKKYTPLYIRIDTRRFQETGEILPVSRPKTVDELFGNVGKAPKGGFSITREHNLIQAIRCLKGKMGILFAYLIENRDPNNQLLYDSALIAKNTGLTQKSVIDNLKYFEECGIIARKSQIIMLFPGIVHRGNRLREGQLIKIFGDMQKSKKESEESNENPSSL